MPITPGSYDPFNCNALVLSDDFVAGTATSGAIGDLGWVTSGGTVMAIQAAELGRPGVIQRDTSASINTVAGTGLRGNFGTGGVVHADDFWDALFIFRPNQVNPADGATRIRVGFSSNWGSQSPSFAAFLEHITTDTNWFWTLRNGGSEDRTNSTIAAAVAWQKLRIRRLTSTTIGFTLNSGAEVSVTTQQPTGSGIFTPGWQIVNTAGASKTIDMDFFALRVNGLNR